jgi:dihydroorotate dehydrogenase (NAD+) catalytic subunit
MARRRSRPAAAGPPVELTTTVGSLELANPVMTASGTAGHGDELARYVDLSRLGAVVVKSL